MYTFVFGNISHFCNISHWFRKCLKHSNYRSRVSFLTFLALKQLQLPVDVYGFDVNSSLREYGRSLRKETASILHLRKFCSLHCLHCTICSHYFLADWTVKMVRVTRRLFLRYAIWKKVAWFTMIEIIAYGYTRSYYRKEKCCRNAQTVKFRLGYKIPVYFWNCLTIRSQNNCVM